MENKKIDVLFGVVVIAFLVAAIVLIKDIRIMRTNDYKDYLSNITTIVKMKNFKIRLLANRLAIAEKQNLDLENTLSETRNDLDALTKKLSQQAPTAQATAPAAPAAAPAAAASK